MRRLLAASIASAVLASAAPAQDAQDDAILVLDASGSMWGQIEGRNKILIARDVIGDLLDALPDERRLGLVAYGHNRRGDCADIETVAAVGADRAAIRAAVNRLQPNGMTPLTDAVRHAAQELNYSQNPATVILVSDGEENCSADPCALAAELEAAGLEFTTHVIGFDISTDEERRQLQCLAEETGGRFIMASNAAELSEALQETVAAEAPAPAVAITTLRLQATDLDGGPVVESGLVWRVAVAGHDGSGIYDTDGAEGIVTLEDIEPRAYDAVVTRPSDGARAEGRIDLPEGVTRTLTLALEIPLDATVRTEPVDSAPAGSEILVHWTGPARDGDWIAIAEVGAREGEFITYERIDASPQAIRMPSEPGQYEARYMLGRPYRTLATDPIEATEVTATVTPPATAFVGSDMTIAWTGPDYESDYIYIAEPDMRDDQQVTYQRTDRGNPAELRAPAEAGSYEARYILNGSPNRVIARASFEVVESEASVTPPATVEAGAPLVVAWTGPDNDGDYIYIAEPDMRDNQQVTYQRTDRGNPAEMRAPAEPGIYEARYVLGVGSRVIARASFEVTAAEATVSPPETVEAGSAFTVAWTGPNNDGDYIYIAEPDMRDNQQVAYVRTDRGNPGELRAPAEPGVYEARYVLNVDTQVIARATFEVTAATASVTPPASVEAGSAFTVDWTGPNNDGDYIYISEVGSRDNQQVGYQRTDLGNPAELTAPGEPGQYEARYILGVGTSVIARAAFEVTPATASFEGAPTSVVAGSELVVPWQGPNNGGDYIYVAEAGMRDNQQVTYARTDSGNPSRLDAPGEPGEYELRYILNAGSQVIARQALTVTAASASFEGTPASAQAGGSVTVVWDGPANARDQIRISAIGSRDNQFETYQGADAPGEIEIRTPSAPGDYELRYVLGSGNIVIARQPITITE
jgi:Ca-activated chloride channel family protein